MSATLDIEELRKQINAMSRQFGEMNETGIARWGVSIARRLAVESQAFGDNAKAYQKQRGAMIKDALMCVSVARSHRDLKLINTVASQTVGGHVRRIIKDPPELVVWINAHRTRKNKRVARILPKNRVLTTQATFNRAMKIKFVAIFKGKGAWVGAGTHIARFQKVQNGKVTIGKSFLPRAHKWAGGGTASMRRSTWNPQGSITSRVPYGWDILGNGAANKAIIDGGKNVVSWYEKVMQGRLNRKKP